MAPARILVLQVALASAATGASLRRGDEATSLRRPARAVDVREVEESLRAAMMGVHGGAVADGLDVSVLDRYMDIEASLWQTFQALPKNRHGRLAPRAVRHVVHNFFAREHGWLIRGLEPHGMLPNASEVHETSILQDRAPQLVEALLGAQGSGRGLAQSDVVGMIAALERLILDESHAYLGAAYELNGLSPGLEVDAAGLDQVLSSYLIILGQGSDVELGGQGQHAVLKAFLAENLTGSWMDLVDFERDTTTNFNYVTRHTTNPFKPRAYSFETVTRVVDSMMQGYGRWQDLECRNMKSALMDLTRDGNGRVPLHVFYSQPESATYQFSESIEYLRNVGAIDESTGTPEVRIVNYLLGPSNCVASSSYFSICCLNECEVLMNEIERRVKAPAASPQQLLSLISNMSSSSQEPRELPARLTAKLASIADLNGGEIPLYGRLFAQWLHHVFPNECPYPALVENVAALGQDHWADQKSYVVAPQERSELASSLGGFADGSDADAMDWSDDEVLHHLYDAQHIRGSGSLRNFVRTIVQGAMLLAALRFAFNGLKAALHARRGLLCKKDDDLPLYC